MLNLGINIKLQMTEIATVEPVNTAGHVRFYAGSVHYIPLLLQHRAL